MEAAHEPHGDASSAARSSSTTRADLESLRIHERPPSGRRSGRRWWRAVAILVGIFAALLAFSWLSGESAREVQVATASKPASGEGEEILSGSGYLVTGERYVSIGVKVPGRIERYFVQEGNSVHKGDPLVQLDDRDYRAAVASAEAGLELSRANLGLADAELRRGNALQGSKVISAQELDVLINKAAVGRATVAQLEAQLAQAQINLEYTTLRAPRDGVILAKLKEVGEIAVPGGFAGSGDLVRMANLADMRAEVDVNEPDLRVLELGGRALVTPDAYPDAGYPAQIVKLYPQIDRQKGTLKVEVKVLEPDGRLLPDMSARVTFLADESTADAARSDAAAVAIPKEALRKDDQGAFVWVVENGRALRKRVEASEGPGARIRVTGGLSGGEAVVVGEAPSVDGEAVAVPEAE